MNEKSKINDNKKKSKEKNKLNKQKLTDKKN